MHRERIKPNDEAHWLELRKRDLTSTEVSALFGESPYITEFELFHLKKQAIDSNFKANERTNWGRHLEEAIARTAANEDGFKIGPMKDYIRIPELRLGSSFDWRVVRGNKTTSIYEIKNVDGLQFKRGWSEEDDGSFEAPMHIEIQVQHQMLVSGIDHAYIRILVGGNRLIKIERTANKEFQDLIMEKCAEFWRKYDADEAPTPNFERDAKTIMKLNSYAHPGLTVTTEDPTMQKLVESYVRGGEMEKEGKKLKDASKAEIITLIGEAEKVIASTYSISAGMVAPSHVPAHDREGYRNFRVYPKKEKTK